MENSLKLFLSEGDEWEGRVNVERSDETMRSGARLIVGIVASVLACVGLSNVFPLLWERLYKESGSLPDIYP